MSKQPEELKFVDEAQEDVVSSPDSVWNDYNGSFFFIYVGAGVCYVCCNHDNCRVLMQKLPEGAGIHYFTFRQKTLSFEHHHLLLSHFYFSRLLFVCVGCWCQSCNLTKAYFKSKNFFSVLHWDAVDIPGQTVLYSVQYNL